MRKTMIYGVVTMLFSTTTFAQEKIKFHSINMAGAAAGRSGTFGILQTVNGLGYKKLFAGVGVGIDYYKDKTIPLFFDVRTSIAETDFFVFGDIGYNFSSYNKPGKEIPYYNTYHFSGGVYNELGIGYKVSLVRKSYLLFSGGYSSKAVNNKIGTPSPCLVAPCPLEYSNYHYRYGRILFKAGVSF